MEKVISLKLVMEGSDGILRELHDIDSALEKIVSGLGKFANQINDFAAATADLAKLRQELKEINKEISKQGGKSRRRTTSTGAPTPPDTSSSGAEETAAEAAIRRQRQLNEQINSGVINLKELRKLLREALNAGQQPADELIEAIARLKANEAAVNQELRDQVRLFREGEGAEGSYRQLSRELSALEVQFQKLGEAQREGALGQQLQQDALRINNQLKELDAQMGNFRRNVGNYASAWDDVRGELVSLAAVLGIGLGLDDFARRIRGVIDSNLELSDSLANVSKTTGLAEDSLDELFNSIQARLLSRETRTDITDLLGLAELGGRLGVAQSQLEGFAFSADRLNVALGDDLGGSVEDVIASLGRLVDIFDIGGGLQGDNVEQSLDQVGSAINELGVQGSNTGDFLVNFANRLAGVAPQARVPLPDVLGLAAALQELGQSPEVAASSLTRFFVEVGKDAETFANIAGRSVEDFRELLETDGTAAFLSVIEGAQSSQEGVEGLAETLDLLGVDQVRAAGTFGVLANNMDLVRRRLETSNVAFEEGTSVLEEFDRQNRTAAAAADQLQNQFDTFTQSTDFQEFLFNVLDGLGRFIEFIAPAINFVLRYAGAFTAATAALIAWNFQTLLAVAAETRLGQAFVRGIAQTRASRAATLADAAAKGVQTTATTAAGRAQQFLNAAMVQNPIGAVVAGLFALTAILATVITRYNRANRVLTANERRMERVNELNSSITEAYAEQAAGLRSLTQRLQRHGDKEEERVQIIQQLNENYGEYLGNLVEETANADQVTDAIGRANAALLEQIAIRIQQERATELGRRLIELAQEQAEAERDLADAQKQKTEANEAGFLEAARSAGNLGVNAQRNLDAATETLEKVRLEVAETNEALNNLGSETQDAIDILSRDLGIDITLSVSTEQAEIQLAEFVNERRRLLQENLSSAAGTEDIEANNQAIELLNKRIEALSRLIQKRNEDAGNQQEASQKSEASLNTIIAIEERLRALRQQRDSSVIDSEEFNAILKEIQQLETVLNRLTGRRRSIRLRPEFPAGSLADIENKISKLTQERRIRLGVDGERVREIDSELDRLIAKKRLLEFGLDSPLDLPEGFDIPEPEPVEDIPILESEVARDLEKETQELEGIFERRQTRIRNGLAASNEELVRGLSSGNVAFDQFNNERERLNNEADSALIQSELAHLDSLRLVLVDFAPDYEDAQMRLVEVDERIADLQTRLRENQLDELKEFLEQVKGFIREGASAREQLQDTVRQGVFDGINIVRDALLRQLEEEGRIEDERFEQQRRAIEKQEQLNQRREQLANARSEEEKKRLEERFEREDRLENLEAQRTRAQEERAEKEEKIRRRTALIAKAITVAEIIFNVVKEVSAIRLATAQLTAQAASNPATALLVPAIQTAGKIQQITALGTAATGIARALSQNFGEGGAMGTIENRDGQEFMVLTEGAHVPAEGLIKGASHPQGGIKVINRQGRLVELEGEEFALQNGPETYIINKRSTRKHRSSLELLRGNSRVFDPLKRIKASLINSEYGVSFGMGGVMGGIEQAQNGIVFSPSSVSTPLPSVSRGSADAGVSNMLAQFDRVVGSMERKTDAIVVLIDETNRRVDRLMVINDPVETVDKGIVPKNVNNL